MNKRNFNRRDAEAQRKTYLFVSYAEGAANNKNLCASASLRFNLCFLVFP